MRLVLLNENCMLTPSAGFVFVLAQAGAAIFPSFTGLIAARAGVQVLQPIILGLIAGGGICWWFIPKVPERSQGSDS